MCIYLPGRVVLRELSCLILLPRSRLLGCSGDFSVLKRTVLLINYYLGGWYTSRLGLLLQLIRRIVINCTTAESVLGLVSTLRLACSSLHQDTDYDYMYFVVSHDLPAHGHIMISLFPNTHIFALTLSIKNVFQKNKKRMTPQMFSKACLLILMSLTCKFLNIISAFWS